MIPKTSKQIVNEAYRNLLFIIEVYIAWIAICAVVFILWYGCTSFTFLVILIAAVFPFVVLIVGVRVLPNSWLPPAFRVYPAHFSSSLEEDKQLMSN